MLPKMDDYIASQNLIDQIYKFWDISDWRNSFQEFCSTILGLLTDKTEHPKAVNFELVWA